MITGAYSWMQRKIIMGAQGMNIVDTLLGMTLIGAEWVLWLLLILSVLSIAVIIERIIYFMGIRLDFGAFQSKLASCLAGKNAEEVEKLCLETNHPAAQMLRSGMEASAKGPKAMETVMSANMANMRAKMDRGITFLGTLGNNAVYIGLFGTVIGIIKAFDALAKEGGAGLAESGASSVMSGISEALVATAVGLFVTIPAVIAFNYFNKQIRKNLSQSESIKKMVVSYYQ